MCDRLPVSLNVLTNELMNEWSVFLLAFISPVSCRPSRRLSAPCDPPAADLKPQLREFTDRLTRVLYAALYEAGGGGVSLLKEPFTRLSLPSGRTPSSIRLFLALQQLHVLNQEFVSASRWWSLCPFFQTWASWRRWMKSSCFLRVNLVWLRLWNHVNS